MWSLLRGTCFVRLAFFFCFDFINTVLECFLSERIPMVDFTLKYKPSFGPRRS